MLDADNDGKVSLKAIQIESLDEQLAKVILPLIYPLQKDQNAELYCDEFVKQGI